MNAAKLLFNYVDFKSFSKSKSDVKTYNCKIFYASWEIVNSKLYVLKLKQIDF